MKESEAVKSKKRSFPVRYVVVGGLLAVAAWLCWKDRFVGPPPPPQSLPTISKPEFDKVREQVRVVGRTLLGVTPEQEKQIDTIWQRPPATLDDLVEFTRKSDAILTDNQRAIVKPVRKMIRNQVIDRILEPGRSRFVPEDFERLKNAIKLRVEKRVEG